MARTCRPLLAGAALVSVCSGVALHAAPRGAPVEEPLRFGGSRSGVSTRTQAKTMAVKGHTVSAVSARWTGKVVYAIFTSAIEKYHNNLLAELDTWAARPAAEGRYVAVGGSNYPKEWETESILKSDCGDDMRSISCKEATLLAEGAARGADWLVVTGEDNYVHTLNVEERLAAYDPNEAVAYGVIGCGKGLYCHENPVFERDGGFCGGSGYIISRGALQKMLAQGAPALHQVYDTSTWPNDMTTSCQLRQYGSDLRFMEDMFGFPMTKIEDYEGMLERKFLTAHYIQAPAMRWMHAHIEGLDDQRIMQLEDDAFDNGCARGMDLWYWHQDWLRCQNVSGRTHPKRVITLPK